MVPMCGNQAEDGCDMTVAELIVELSKLDQTLSVKVYESDPDTYVDIGLVECTELDGVHLMSQYEIDVYKGIN